MVERLVHSIVRQTLKHRWFSLGWLAAFTIFFAYQALAVRMYSKFSDLLPQAHPYVVAYNHFRQIFGTANVMTLELQVRRGDIFTAKTLHKIRFIHQQLDLMDGVDHNLINSITGTNARKVIATSGGLIISRPLLADKIPTSLQTSRASDMTCCTASPTACWSRPTPPAPWSRPGSTRVR
jgi:predicted RND superfamily exporter protein